MALAAEPAPWPPARVSPGAAAHPGAAREDSCLADPTTPLKDWVYREAAIGFVLSGWFEYRTERGAALTPPGGVVFGNAGEAFSVRHLDDRGNRRLVVTLPSAVLEEVAAVSRLDDLRFPAATLPPGPRATRMLAWMRRCEQNGAPAEELLLPLALDALTASGARALGDVSALDRRRVQAAARHIEAHFDEPCPLDALAALAGLSRWQFVRTFGAVMGQSPIQYLINTRIRAAAERLLTTRTPIVELALEVGFGDVSHFYACFRAAFGCTPRRWRTGR